MEWIEFLLGMRFIGFADKKQRSVTRHTRMAISRKRHMPQLRQQPSAFLLPVLWNSVTISMVSVPLEVVIVVRNLHSMLKGHLPKNISNLSDSLSKNTSKCVKIFLLLVANQNPRHSIYIRTALQTHPCNENRVFPVSFSQHGKPVFISWDPCNENRFFPVGNKLTGKTLFWPCTDPLRDCSE